MSSKAFTGEGIKESQIENYDQYRKILESFTCPICLDIVKNPHQCELCETLYCDECWDFIKIAGKKCVMHCTAPVVKANKFVLDTLSKLRITCETCNKTNIEYNLYIMHYEVCGHLQNLVKSGEIERQLEDKRKKIISLDKEIAEIKKNGLSNIGNQKGDFSKSEIQKKLLTFSLNATDKVLLYEASVQGKLNEFRTLILDKKFPLFEEVSAAGYLWTSLHYAMHYGKEDIIFFILDHCYNKLNCIDMALNLVSKDGRCPILCLLKSNSNNNEKKKELMKRIISRYKGIKLSEEALREMRVRKMEDIYLKK
jgi:hypothetical protein